MEMIVNSHRAAAPAEWGWGTPIVHGMNPEDWFDLEKEPRVFTALSPGGCDEYYNRECANEVATILKNKYGHELWWAKVNVDTGKSFDFYRKFLGTSLVYFDSSFRTPMNRGRTEAMLSGCCVVQVEGAHDLERFARPGKNMVIVPNRPEEIAATITDLIENRFEETKKIGQEGKKTALEFFTYPRYRADWLEFLKQKIWK
jgi:glycosyltransferase involved in cell wall biosynthesis